MVVDKRALLWCVQVSALSRMLYLKASLIQPYPVQVSAVSRVLYLKAKSDAELLLWLDRLTRARQLDLI